MSFETRDTITADAVAERSREHRESPGIITKWTFGVDFPDRPAFEDVRDRVFESANKDEGYPVFAPILPLNETYYRASLNVFAVEGADYDHSMVDMEIATEVDEDGNEVVEWFRVYVRDDPEKTDPRAVAHICDRLADDYAVDFRFPVADLDPEPGAM